MPKTKQTKLSKIYYSEFDREIKIVSIILLVTFLLGFAQSSNPPQFVVDALQGLYELAEQVVLGNKNLFSVILINNITAVFTIIIGGLVLGISPVLSSIINGYLIGVIGGELINQGQWQVFVVGLIPHGLIEIPALVLSLALGLRLGIIVWKILLKRDSANLSMRSRIKLNMSKLWTELKRSLQFAITVIVPLIILAAVVESFITPELIELVV